MKAAPRIAVGDLSVDTSPGMRSTRFGSIGDCPCLAVTMIKVESNRCFLLSSVTIKPIELSTNAISDARLGLGVPVPSR